MTIGGFYSIRREADFGVVWVRQIASKAGSVADSSARANAYACLKRRCAGYSGSMTLRLPSAASLALAVALCAVGASHADELKLKDGSKVTGTIVGFEENSFKVKTSYGFAVVMKDQVVSITISDSGKASDRGWCSSSESVEARGSEGSYAAAGDKTFGDAGNDSRAEHGHECGEVRAIGRFKFCRGNSAAAPAPAKPAAPEPIRESVDGKTYTNETYGFQMYKPPDWKVIEGAPAICPAPSPRWAPATRHLLADRPGPRRKNNRERRGLRRSAGCATSWKTSARSMTST